MEAVKESGRRRQERTQPERWRIEFVSSGGEPLALLQPEEKQFKTGSRGFYAGGKCEFNGKKYQVSCSVVEIGSKPGSEKPTMN